MGGVASCISNIMYITEKMTLCTACTGLICCLVLTITMTLGMGIGLGYNYCFVDMRTKYKYIKGHYIYPGNPRWPYKREGNAADEPEPEDVAVNDALSRQLYKAEEISSLPDVIMTRRPFSENPRFKDTSVDDGNTNYYHPMIPDPVSYNETESSVKTIVEEIITDATTVVAEAITETNNSNNTSIPKSSNTTTSTSSYESSRITASTAEAATEATNEAITEATTEAATEATTESKGETNELSPKTTTLKDSSSRKVKKLIIPITGLDLISLLSKLSAENKNYSLQVVTT